LRSIFVVHHSLAAFLAIAGLSSTAWAAPFDTTTKNFGGVDWYILNDYGTTETRLEPFGNPLDGGPWLTFRNTSVGPGTTVGGAGIWLNQASSNNTSGISAANVAFWNLMRSSSYLATDTTPWIRWALQMNYAMGTSQNDLTINGPGGTATSVAGGAGPDGTLPFEPPAFGGDRISIGRQFSSAYDINPKGTGAGSVEFFGDNSGPNTAWVAAPTVNSIGTPGSGATYVATTGDIMTITLGKRPDGTIDIYWDGPDIIGTTPGHFVGTMSTDNPDWFFYQLEIRARGSTGTPLNSEQDLLLFQYGNDWGDLGDGVWGVLSEVPPVPEPGSFALVGLGGLFMAARRRRRR
jgi:hypothetical protein